MLSVFVNMVINNYRSDLVLLFVGISPYQPEVRICWFGRLAYNCQDTLKIIKGS